MGLERHHLGESCNSTDEKTEIRRIKWLIKVPQRVAGQGLEVESPALSLPDGAIWEELSIQSVINSPFFLIRTQVQLFSDEKWFRKWMFPPETNRKDKKSLAFCFEMALQPRTYMTMSCISLTSMLNPEWWQSSNSLHRVQESICCTPNPLEIPNWKKTRATEKGLIYRWRISRWISDTKSCWLT